MKYKSNCLLLAIVFLGALIFTMVVKEAQAETQVKNQAEAWRAKPPQLPGPRPYKLPPVNLYKLDNGLTVELVEDHRVPFITVNLGVRTGSCQDPANLHGVAAMTAGMLTEGTKNLTSKQIAEEIDFIGGGLKGGSDYDFTLIIGSALSQYTDRLFKLMSDVVLTPSFPDDELALNKSNLIQELVMKRSQPDFLQEERFNYVVFGQHPYSVTSPSPEEVEHLTKKDLEAFHKQYYLPNQAVLVVVGDFNSAKMKDLIQKSFGVNWQSGKNEAGKFPAYPEYHGKRIYLVDRPGSVQASLKLGNIGICKTDADYFPFMVANQILGGAAHSRLFLNIREQKGYTYGAYSSFAARKQPGAFASEAEVRTEVTAPALQEFLYELYKMRNLKVSDKELKDAQTFLVGSFQLGLETQAGLAQRLLEGQLYELPADYLETYANKIMSVSLDDVRKVARKHIDCDDMTIVVVGDANKIKSDLEYFAPVEVYDMAGKSRQSASSGAAKKGS